MSIGKKIKELRKQQKISADVIGKYCGHSGRQWVYDVEKAVIKEVSRGDIKKLAELLKVAPEYLLEEEEKRINEDYVFYSPKNDFSKITNTAEKIALIMEENRQLWQENALLKKLFIEKEIQISTLNT